MEANFNTHTKVVFSIELTLYNRTQALNSLKHVPKRNPLTKNNNMQHVAVAVAKAEKTTK